MSLVTYPVCTLEGECFARDEKSKCTILTVTPAYGRKCNFQKPQREFTNGEYYPHYKAVRGKYEYNDD